MSPRIAIITRLSRALVRVILRQSSIYNSRDICCHSTNGWTDKFMGQWLASIVVNGVEIGNTMHGHNSLAEHQDSAPTYASYVNSSLSPVTFTVTLRPLQYPSQTGNCIFLPAEWSKDLLVPFRGSPTLKERTHNAKAYAHRAILSSGRVC